MFTFFLPGIHHVKIAHTEHLVQEPSAAITTTQHSFSMSLSCDVFSVCDVTSKMVTWSKSGLLIVGENLMVQILLSDKLGPILPPYTTLRRDAQITELPKKYSFVI